MKTVVEKNGHEYPTQYPEQLQGAIDCSQGLICSVIVYRDYHTGKIMIKLDADNNPANEILYRCKGGFITTDMTPA